MKTHFYITILISIVISFYSCTDNEYSPETLNYTFELSNEKTAVHVTLEYKRNTSTDTTTFKVPVNFDRNILDTLAIAKNIRLISKGKLIKVTPDTYQYIGNKNTIIIKYSISSFSEETRYLSCKNEDYFMPTINKHFFHFYSSKSLIFPEVENEENNLFKTEISWLNFDKEWEIANDFGILEKKKDRKKQLIKSITIDDLSQMLFFGGEYRQSTFSINNINFHTYIYGDFNFADSTYIKKLEIVAKANLDLWNYFGKKNDYIINLTQRGNDCGRVGGTNMYNSFVTYMSGNFTEQDLPNIFINAFTHEFTHTWIGGDFVSNAGSDWTKIRWFTEGFCEYYAMHINVKAGIIPRRKLMIYINRNYLQYRLSPYANKSLDYISDNFEYSQTLAKIDYTKGAAFAFYLDGYIRNQTNSKFNLTDYMVTLMNSKERIAGNLNLELMNSIAIDSLGIDISNILEKYVIKGEYIPLESPIIETTMTKNYTAFDYGFNFIESARNEMVSGVIENSNAYKSGLRNGQRLLSIKNITTRASGSIILEVSENEEILIIEYKPEGKALSLSIIEKLISVD